MKTVDCNVKPCLYTCPFCGRKCGNEGPCGYCSIALELSVLVLKKIIKHKEVLSGH